MAVGWWLASGFLVWNQAGFAMAMQRKQLRHSSCVHAGSLHDCFGFKAKILVEIRGLCFNISPLCFPPFL